MKYTKLIAHPTINKLLIDSMVKFKLDGKTENDCIEYLEKVRWDGYPVSPFVPESRVYACTKKSYRCRISGKYFDVKTGTFMQNTKLTMLQWFYIIQNYPAQKQETISKDLNLTQGTISNALSKVKKAKNEAIR